jgi:hypothetical protein
VIPGAAYFELFHLFNLTFLWRVAEGRCVVVGIHTYKYVHSREHILHRTRLIENTGWSAYIRTNVHSGIPSTRTQTSSHTDEAEGAFEGRKVLHSQKLHAHSICNSN